MKKLGSITMAVLAASFLVSGVAFAQEWKGKSETKTVTGIQVELTIPAEGLKVGENNVSVRMKEAQGGQAVVREFARIDLMMDEGDKSMNHGSMSNQKPVAVELKAVASEQGRYEGKVSISDPGDWNLRVFTDSRGIGSPATFKVRADKAAPAAAPQGSAASASAPQSAPATADKNAAGQASGPNWLVIGGFGILILAAIGGVGALVKKSSASAPGTPTQETNKA